MCTFVKTKHNSINKSFPLKSRVRKRAAISYRDSQVAKNGHQSNSVHGAKVVKAVSLNTVATASSRSMVRWHQAESNPLIEASLHPNPASIRLQRRVRNMYKCQDISLPVRNVNVELSSTKVNSDSIAHSAYRWTPKLLKIMVNRNEVTTINLSTQRSQPGAWLIVEGLYQKRMSDCNDQNMLTDTPY